MLPKKPWSEVVDTPDTSPRARIEPLDEMNELMNDNSDSHTHQEVDIVMEGNSHQQNNITEASPSSGKDESLQIPEHSLQTSEDEHPSLHQKLSPQSREARQTSAEEEEPTVFTDGESITPSEITDEEEEEEEDIPPIYRQVW